MLLHPVNNDFSHYVGIATFLRGIPFLEPKALVRPDKRHASEPPLVADFEPWIERATVFPRSHLPYVCPMHPQQGVMHPGRCPICGMPLEPNKALRPWGVLHDPATLWGSRCFCSLHNKTPPILLSPQSRLPRARGIFYSVLPYMPGLPSLNRNQNNSSVWFLPQISRRGFQEPFYGP